MIQITDPAQESEKEAGLRRVLRLSLVGKASAQHLL